jgi:hypothetical protein
MGIAAAYLKYSCHSVMRAATCSGNANDCLLLLLLL